METPILSEEELNEVYNWVDEIPLSRPKKNIARDFADGVLLAEIFAHYFPRLVELHNYVAVNSSSQKIHNLSTLNQKVFKKLGFQLARGDIEAVATCVPEAIERVLKVCKGKIERALSRDEENQPPPPPPPPQALRQVHPQALPSTKTVRSPIERSPQRHEIRGKGDSNLREIIIEKEQTIEELRETITILETKTRKLEHLLKLKDGKIQSLTSKLAQYEQH